MNRAPTELEVFIHDIASPLTNIGISLENMKSHIYTNPRKLEKTIVATLDSLEFLHSISRIHNSYFFDNKNTKYSVEEFVRKIVTNKFGFIIEQNKILLLYDVQEEFAINYDKLLLNRVITNIISNSIDALLEKNPHKPKKIKISINKLQNKLVITILDNGIGVDNNLIKEIFNYGYSEKDSHFGIGLPVTKDIIENRFGGVLKFQSLSGIGTLVKIILPI